jgi:hypothetical protein
MMKNQRNVMAFTRRSFSAAVMLRFSPRAFSKVLALTLAIAMTTQLMPSQLISSAEAEPVNTNTTPRKILTGWIPYYGMSTSLPTAVANADLISEVMPFWYTLKLNSKTKTPYILDLYTPGNPSVSIDVPLTTMRNAGFKIIPTITDGTEKLVLAKLLATYLGYPLHLSLCLSPVKVCPSARP